MPISKNVYECIQIKYKKLGGIQNEQEKMGIHYPYFRFMLLRGNKHVGSEKSQVLQGKCQRLHQDAE
jgi:hypothetical protein